ncbi:hypothetical protein F7725_006849 [Dissostichus mawsoni]|uniref:Uncharacterized protein n=1 Tax=Dissostichus mawsoni TaxID=36200 RepID=A0A7J5XWP5_DISMA|nr:hypothetical protein F7725_006849 [Dissostichus mawsoni]
MVSAGIQILGAALGILGWIGAIIVCAIPIARARCSVRCNDSMLALSSDMQAARALIILSIVVGVLAILLSVAGGQCTNCGEDPASKTKVGIAAGVMFIVAGVLCLILSAGRPHTIIQNFYNP